MRIAAAFPLTGYSNEKAIAAVIETELGIDASLLGTRINLQKLVAKAELRDVLDLITILSAHLRKWRPDLLDGFIIVVNRVFNEENVGYKADSLGTVHFAIDEEFEQSRTSTVAILGQVRYASIAKSYEEAFSFLDSDPMEGRTAIRSVFGTLEALFKLMFIRAPRLGGHEVDQHLKPKLDLLYISTTQHGRAMSKMLASFKDWIEAAHFYRHEPAGGDDSQPSLDMTVLMMSSGSSWLRWLAEVDYQMQNLT